MLKFHKNKIKQQGFTLIELVIVIAIISTIVGISILSINLARPSAGMIFSEKLKNNIDLSERFSKNYNKATKIFIDEKKKKIIFYWLDSKTNKWHINKDINQINFNKFNIVADLQNINILPNGFINKNIITINQDDKSWEIITGEQK